MDPTAALRQHFGFDAFRPGQEQAVRAAIGPPARDVLVVMATGAGKSLCYGGGEARQPGASVEQDLDAAITAVVTSASPPVGRTRTVEILRGGRSKALLVHGYDGLAQYATFDHLGAREVLARVDELIDRGHLRVTGGAFPRLQAVPVACAA